MKACRKIERKYYKYGNMPNVTVVGSPTINNGVISGFSTSKFATGNLLQTFSAGSVNSFDITLKVKTPSSWTSNGRVINWKGGADSTAGPYIEMISNQKCNLTFYNGSTYTNFTAKNSLSNNTEYWLRWAYDGVNVYSYYKLADNDEWILNETKTCTASVVRFTRTDFAIGIRSHDCASVCVWNGSIDLKESYMKINEKDCWRGTLAETGIFYDTNVIFNGLPSVSSSAILSGFNSTSWVTLPNIFSPNSNNWEMLIKFKIGSLGVFQDIVNSPIESQPVTIRIDNNNYLLAKGFLNNTTTQVFSINGVTPLEAGINYWVKLDYNNQNGYTLKLSIDGETFITEGTSAVISSVTSGYKLALGVDFTTDGAYYGYPFTGSIDLKECYIKIADENWWTGATQQQATSSDYDFYKDIYKYNLIKQNDTYKAIKSYEKGQYYGN